MEAQTLLSVCKKPRRGRNDSVEVRPSVEKCSSVARLIDPLSQMSSLAYSTKHRSLLPTRGRMREKPVSRFPEPTACPCRRRSSTAGLTCWHVSSPQRSIGSSSSWPSAAGGSTRRRRDKTTRRGKSPQPMQLREERSRASRAAEKTSSPTTL